MNKITTNYCELQPAYGRDCKTKAEAEQAFREGKDWEGDYSLGFKLCSIRDFENGVKVNLRYSKATKVTVVTV